MAKRFWALALASMVALLAACGGSKPTGPAPGSNPAPVSGSGSPAASGPWQPSCAQPKEVQGFLTCADVEKAKKEGAVVAYSSEVETQLVALLGEFHKLFPEIDSSKYTREQVGRAYAKLSAERKASTYFADIWLMSDPAITVDFSNKGGFTSYASPYAKEYDDKFRSAASGQFIWYALNLGGIAYNPTVVPDSEAPKSYKDLLNPTYKGAINFKDSASGLQAVQWYMVREVMGDSFWKDMAAQKPRQLASTVQQYERVISKEDKIVGLAQFSTYLEQKAKGAPVGFAAPSEGLVVAPWVAGVVDKAPHTEAAKLFMDWLLSPKGQQAYVKITYYYSPRSDVAPPAGGKPITEYKLLIPDWAKFDAAHNQYIKDWNALVGL